MQLDSESGDEDEEDGDLHLLMLAPDLLMDQDATMDSVLFFPTSHTVTDPLMASANPFVEGEASSSQVGISPPRYRSREHNYNHEHSRCFHPSFQGRGESLLS